MNKLHFLSGKEKFIFKNQETEMTMLDFWRWHYSEIFDLQEKIAEYIVAKLWETKLLTIPANMKEKIDNSIKVYF